MLQYKEAEAGRVMLSFSKLSPWEEINHTSALHLFIGI